jgi:hypothetical protein
MVGVVDNRDAAAAKERLERYAVAQSLLVAVIFVSKKERDWQRRLIRRQTDHVQIGMIADPMQVARLAAAARLQRLVVGFCAKQPLGQLQGEVALANTRRTSEQIRAGQPSTLEGEAKTLHHVVMS